jgi:hypothetical protein
MKQSFKVFFFLIFASIASISFSQSIELRPNAMYTFRERFPVYSGDVTIQDGASYGAELAYIANNKVDINFTYQIQSTTLDIRRFPSFLGDYGNKGNISFYELGFNRLHNLPGNNKVIPYTGAKFGVAYLNLENSKYEDITRACLGLNAGVKVMFSDKIGINLYGLLQSPISGLALTVSAGSGGVSTGVGTYSYVLQFSLGGGLVIKLK